MKSLNQKRTELFRTANCQFSSVLYFLAQITDDVDGPVSPLSVGMIYSTLHSWTGTYDELGDWSVKNVIHSLR